MSSSSGARGAPKRRRSSRLAAKGGGTPSAADSAEQRVPLHNAAAKGGGTSLASGVHGPQHRMHLAIERSTNFKDVQKLLDEGETFCTGDGLNCFVLIASKWTKDSTHYWDMLMKMLQIDSRGIRVRDPDGLPLLNYFSRDVDKMKKLIELGADLNNVDNSRKTLIQSLFSSDVFEKFKQIFAREEYKTNFIQLWKMLLEHKEIQSQVTKGDFLDQLVLRSNDDFSGEMICILVQKGILSVEELQAKMKMHPLFVIIQLKYCNDERLELLHYIWKDDPNKNENITALGADLNILDNNGRNLLECLFDPDNLEQPRNYCDWTKNPFSLKIWKLLIKHKEIQSQASKDGFLRSIAPFAMRCTVLSGMRHIFENMLRLDIWSIEKLSSELQMHPLFFLMKIAKGHPPSFLKVLKSYPSFLKDKTITATTKIDECWSRGSPSCQNVKALLNIPDIPTFDIFGYILFTFNFAYVKDLWESACDVGIKEQLFECLTTLLKYGFEPSSAAGVVHPIHALLYNINYNSFCPDSSQKKLPDILQKTITILNDFPIPHKLVQDPETGNLMLDVQVLMSMMLYSALMDDSNANMTLFEFIKKLMQLSPLHPLRNFASIYNHVSCYFQYGQCKKATSIETFCKLLRLTLEASGSHKFQAVDQKTIECINRFCESVKELPQSPNEAEEISLHRKAAIKAESEMSSLKWLSILQIRKTLFQSRTNTTVTLPSLIKGLVAEGRLPKGLEADVLVYKHK